MKRPYRGKATVLTVLGILAGWSLSAHADDESPAIEVDPQPLAAALNSFSEQTGMQFAYISTVADGIESPGTSGEASPTQALDSLLAETGLTYNFINDTTIVIAAVESSREVHEGGDSDPKNSGHRQPLLIAQNVASQGVATSDRPTSEVGAASVVTGRVTAARTGANLKGALVTIEETGQSTAADDLGRFRFPNVVLGTYTIRVSYLGYEDQSASIRVADAQVAQDFSLRGRVDIEEITVFGQRSSRAIALNQERSAQNVTTVLSADILGQLNGTTVSEVLRRAPGVAFVPDPITGDGVQVIVRGLEPDLNQVTLNGVRLLDGTGLGRSPDLSGILTESIERVTVNKTLLPSQDSNGAGALIEIETKAPLDRDARFSSFGLEYGEAGGDFGDEFGINGTISGIFGSNSDFGSSLSASYREREVTRISYDQGSGSPQVEVLPLTDSAGGPIGFLSQVNPLLDFPFEPEFNRVYPGSYSASEGSSDQETLSIIAALQKKFDEHTELRFDVVYTQDSVENYGASTNVSPNTNYDLAPVDALNGQTREVLVGEDIFRNDLPFLADIFGTGIPGFIGRSSSLEPNTDSTTLSLRLGGETVSGSWEFDYSVGYVESKNEASERYSLNLGFQDAGTTGFLPALIGRELLSDEALNNVTGDGRIISVFPAFESGADGRFLLPLFNEEGFAFYNAADNFPVSVNAVGPRTSEGEETSLFGSARRSFDLDYLDYLEAGIDYRETTFFSPGDVGSSRLGSFGFENADGVTPSELGLVFGPGILSRVGADNDFNALSRGSVEAFVANIDTLIADGLLVQDSDDLGRLDEFRDTTEDTLAFYLEGSLNFGKLELIGGIRFEHIEVGSTFFSSPRVVDLDGRTQLLSPDEFGQLLSDEVSQTNILPRLLANYRISENMVLRGAYFTTVSRPQLSNLTDQQELILRLDPSESSTGDRPVLEIRQGNPDLEPALTHSFDLGWEWYSDDIGVLKIGAFYKLIKNPLQSNRIIGGVDLIPADLVLPDAPFFNDLPDPLELSVSRPENSEDDNEIWGLELTAERQFTFLPAGWSGLGLYANYAYTDSSSKQRLGVSTSIDPRGFVEFDDVPFEGSPEHQGTFGFTYSRYNVDGSLLYSAQSRRLSSLGAFGFDIYDEAVETLDLRIDYLWSVNGRDVRFFFRAEDLLSGDGDAYLQTSIGGEDGVPKYFTGGTYFGGRSFFGGVIVVF